MNTLTGYLGTYASPLSHGIYRFTLNLGDGTLSLPELYYNAPDCKYLSLSGHLLAAPVKQDGKAGIQLIDIADGTLLGEEFHEAGAACYVIQDERYLYTANYHEGTVLIYEKTPHGPKLTKRIDIAPKAGCHQIMFHSHYMLVPCLLLDSVKIFDCQNDFAPAGELTFNKGTGPRHGIFDEDHSRLFLVSELSNEVFVYYVSDDEEGAGLHLDSVYPLLPQNAVYSQAPASAAIRLSPDEHFLYISTRFAEIITVFSIDGCTLTMIQQTDCGGIHPRDFCLTPDGGYLLAVNRTEGGLVSFPIDRKNGHLMDICSRVPALEAVSIVLDTHVSA